MEEFATTATFHISPKLQEAVMQFVCKIFSSEPSKDDANIDLVLTRMHCRKTWDVERRIPSMSDALNQHLKTSVFQTSIGITVQGSCNYKWLKKDSGLVPIWTTLPIAKYIVDVDV